MQFQGPLQPGVDTGGETYRTGNTKENLGVRNKRSRVKSGMWENTVSFLLCQAASSILDLSSFLLSSAVTWTGSLLQAAGGNHFVKIPTVCCVASWLWKLTSAVWGAFRRCCCLRVPGLLPFL